MGSMAAAHASDPMLLDQRFSPDVLSPDAKKQIVGIRLTGESTGSSSEYGNVLGYFKGKKSTTSEVVKLTAGDNVVFVSVEPSLPHTASFLGDASASGADWPTKFTGSSKASPAGTTLATTGFSTGTLDPGQKSAVYNAGSPGFYMFGCFYHYVPDQMRTVIIVQ
jgi:plastocyanin